MMVKREKVHRVARLARLAALGLTAVLAASTLGGCFLFFPRRAKTPIGSAAQPGRIEGRIVDERNQGVVGASATIPEAGQLMAVTGTDGRVSFSGVAPGVAYVQVKKEGYLAGSFGVTVLSGQTAQFTGQLLPSSGNLHNGSSRVPNLCADCHQLHNPTSASYVLKGDSPNSPCFTCHTPGLNRGFDSSVYENSPHGRLTTPNSPTLTIWTGQYAGARGYCSTCHEPHGISGPPLLLRKGLKDPDGTLHLNDLCFECHSAPGSGNTVNWPGKAAYVDTLNLHANATIVPPATLQKYPGTTYAMGDCGNCHVPHGQSFGGTNDPHMLRDQGYQLCLKCHTDKIDAGGTGHNGNCLVCHDPHRVTKAGTLLNVKDPANGTGFIPVPKETYRAADWTATSYCTGCHNASPPSWLPVTARNPYAATTKFWNTTARPDRNLHNVHVNRVVSGYAVVGHADTTETLGVTGDFNKVKCSQCHRAHQSSVSRNLDSSYVTSITGGYSGDYGSKNGCTVAGGCHSCAWCHSASGSPGVDCFCDGYHANPGPHTISY